MTILVTGATGTIGGHLTRLLVDEGRPVRALTRRPDRSDLPPGVEVAGGDLTRPSTLTPALFDGVEQVFVWPADGVEALLDAAVANGVSRFVVLSSLAAAGTRPREIASVSYEHHRAVEQAVAERTGDFTFLRPGSFATNLLSWAIPIRAGQPVRAPYLDAAQAPIHEQDIAEAAAHVLIRDAHRGEAIALTGPQALTRREQIGAIAAAISRPVETQEISPEQFGAEFGRWLPPGIESMLLDYWAETVTRPDVPHSVEPVTGRPGRTLAEWAADHRADFTATTASAPATSTGPRPRRAGSAPRTAPVR